MLFLSFQKKYSWNQNLKLCLCFILSWLNLQSFPVSPLLQRFEIQVFTNGEHVEQWGTFYLGQTTNNTPRGNWELIQEVTKEPRTTQIRSVFTTHQLPQFKLHAAVSLTKQTHSTFNCERKKQKHVDYVSTCGKSLKETFPNLDGVISVAKRNATTKHMLPHTERCVFISSPCTNIINRAFRQHKKTNSLENHNNAIWCYKIQLHNALHLPQYRGCFTVTVKLYDREGVCGWDQRTYHDSSTPEVFISLFLSIMRQLSSFSFFLLQTPQICHGKNPD